METIKAYGLDRASFNQGKNAKYGFSVLDDQQPTLTAKGAGGGCTIKAKFYDGSQTAATLTANNASGNQRMPDKENFNCVLVPTTHYGEPVVAYSIENHPADSRVDIDKSGKVQTLTTRMGTGGGNVPMVMQAYRKTAHPINKYEPQGWEKTTLCDTLNVFDNSETRTPTIIVES